MALQSMASKSTISLAIVASEGSRIRPRVSTPSSVATKASLNGAFATSASVAVKVLEEKSVGELRLLAKERGLRGDTKNELIKLLASAPASSSNGSPAVSSPSTSAVPDLDAKQLEQMPIGELRSIARARGVYGASKKELIKELLGSLPQATRATVSTPAAPAPSPAQVIPPPAATTPPPPAPSPSISLEKQLQSKPLSVLRAIARQRGVRGDSKDAIIKALLALPSSATAPVASSSPTPSALTAVPAVAPAESLPTPVVTPVSTSPSPTPSSLRQQLQTKPLSLLKAMARQKGVKGNTKEQLVAALSADVSTSVEPAVVPLASTSVSPSEPVASEALLAGKTVAELRALAKERGIRGDTKGELIQLLLQNDSASGKSVATAVKEAVEPTTVLPPFESQVSSSETAALEPFPASQLASEVSSLREAMEKMRDRDSALEEEKNSLIEQANFLRNVLVGGIGLALVPLMLPVNVNSGLSSSTSTSSTLSTPIVLSPVEPAPVVLSVGPEEFCKTLPASLRSPEAQKLCQAVSEIDLSS